MSREERLPPEPGPAGALVSDTQPPDLGEMTVRRLSCPVSGTITVAPADQDVTLFLSTCLAPRLATTGLGSR